MADITKLKTFMDAYGIGVRAGVITPNLEDEKAIRKMFDLPEASDAVVSEWSRTKGVRFPITLAKELSSDNVQEETNV